MNDFNPGAYTLTGTSKKQEALYSDVALTFDFHPGTKDIVRITEQVSIANSLKNILKTNKYERLYNPRFGANLNQMLFELLDSRNLSMIESTIRFAIENYEPRVKVRDVIVTGLVDEETVAITLVYDIINIEGLQTLDLQITRVR